MALLSYACGKGQRNLRFVTIPTLLRKRAAETPDKAAHVFRTEQESGQVISTKRKVITFSHLAQTSHRVATSLLSIGIQPNDNIAILGQSCPEFVYMEFACLRLSVLNFRLPLNFIHADELLSVLEKYQIKALVVHDIDIVKRLEKVLPGIILKDNADPDREWPPNLKQIIFLVKPNPTLCTRIPHTSVDDLSVGSSQHIAALDKCEEAQDPEDPALVFPTSGSTGKAKFVLHSHFSVTNGLELPHTEQSGVLMSDRPMTWIGGAPLMSVLWGSTTVHIDSTLTTHENGVKEYLNIVNEEQATTALWALYLMQDIIKENQRPNASRLPKSLKTIIVGGERFPQEALDSAYQICENILMGYGMTECWYVACSSPFARDSETLTWKELAPTIEVKICNDHGKMISRGVPGNVIIRSVYTFLQYVNDADMTKNTINENGWVKTGDIGVMNDQGQIKIVGRSKDIISRGANKIYPSVIEGILIKHPKVHMVVVVAVPDKRLFNEICACIVTKSGEALTAEELLSFCQRQSFDDKSLTVPKYFLFCDGYPRNTNGKIDKMILSQMAVDKFKLAFA